jgi:hypothetical protein
MFGESVVGVEAAEFAGIGAASAAKAAATLANAVRNFFIKCISFI